VVQGTGKVITSDVDRHRFDADPDPDPNFHVMQMQIRIRIGIKMMPPHADPTQVSHMT
jgi:hypothetical protein